MRTTARTLPPLLLLALGIACASNPSKESTQREDRTVLTQQQMLERGFTNVYDAVLALRANWLSPRGRDSFTAPSQVWVYIDNTRAGGIDRLRLLQPTVVSTVRFFEGTEAQGRWGVGHSAGVILVSTWSTDREGLPTPQPRDSQPDSIAIRRE